MKTYPCFTFVIRKGKKFDIVGYGAVNLREAKSMLKVDFPKATIIAIR